MSWNRAFRLNSFAQIFSILVLAGFFTAPIDANATSSYDCLNTKKADYTPQMEKDCASVLSNGSSSSNNCSDLKRTLDDKRDAYYKACSSANVSSSTCSSKSSTCASVGSDDEYGNNAQLLSAFSEALGVPQDQVGSSCPKYSGQDYFEQKKDLEKQLDEVNDKIKKNKQDLADLNKDFTDDVQKVQEEIADAQKDYQQQQTDINQKRRDRAADQAKQAAEMTANVKKMQTDILTKQQEKDTIYADKNSSLKQLTEDSANYACMDKVKKDYDTLKGLQQRGSSKSLIASGTTLTNRLKNSFNQCMAQFYDARMKLIQQSDAKIALADKTINDTQSQIDNTQTQLSQMSTQEQQAQTDENTTLTNAQNALQQKIQRATAKLQSLQQTTQQKQQAITDDQTAQQKKSTSISNQILALGAVPSGGSKSSGTMMDISNADQAYRDAYNDYSTYTYGDSDTHCPNIKNILDSSSSYSKSSSRSSSRSGSRSSSGKQ